MVAFAVEVLETIDDTSVFHSTSVQGDFFDMQHKRETRPTYVARERSQEALDRGNDVAHCLAASCDD